MEQAGHRGVQCRSTDVLVAMVIFCDGLWNYYYQKGPIMILLIVSWLSVPKHRNTG